MSSENENKRKQYPNDTVILHHIERGLRAPSASPFCLKLETWLRMAKLPYQNDFSFEFSKKGQIPFITFNNEDIPDSQMCIEYLSKQFNINLNKNFTDENKAIARAFLKMTEESLRWQIALRRFVFNIDPDESSLSLDILQNYATKIRDGAWSQGYGRHSEEEVTKIGQEDLKAINDFIGNKKYFFGDSLCDLDACLFGFLCQFLYHDRGPINKYINSDCQNILRYLNDIKNEYWKDWNECITQK